MRAEPGLERRIESGRRDLRALARAARLVLQQLGLAVVTGAAGGRATTGPDHAYRVDRRIADEGAQLTADAARPGSAAGARAGGRGPISDASMLRLIRATQTELVGSGPLTASLADPRITDVVVKAPVTSGSIAGRVGVGALTLRR